MGSYTKSLYRRKRNAKATMGCVSDEERLTACAIVRDGVTHSGSAQSHVEIRRALGDEDPYLPRSGDTEGFVTSTGRFVSRSRGQHVAQAAGQCQRMERELLSSDVRWS